MIEILLEAERNLSHGRLEPAERLYRQAADADPRNAIAVVGLGRVALERGDERGALALVERALGIDPENEAARRMADRLREVLGHRTAEGPAAPPPAGDVPSHPGLPVTGTVPTEPPAADPVAPEPSPGASSGPSADPATTGADAPHPAAPPVEPEPPVEPVGPHPAAEPEPEPPAERVEPAPAATPDGAATDGPAPDAAEGPPEPVVAPPRRRGLLAFLRRLFGRR